MARDIKMNLFNYVGRIFRSYEEEFHPEKAFLKEKYRHALSVIKQSRRDIEAVLADRWHSEWIKSGSGPNASFRSDRQNSINLIRHLYINNALVRGIIEKNTCYVVGKGITPQIDFSKITIADSRREKIENIFKEHWEEWCKRDNSDLAETESFSQRQRSIYNAYQRDGEILILITKGKGKYSFSTELIEADRLINTLGYDNSNVVDGIEIDSNGKPIAYHIEQQLKNDNTYNKFGQYSTKRISKKFPDNKQQIIHFFKQERPNQIRGYSQIIPALVEIEETTRFREAVITCGRVSALYGIFISGGGTLPGLQKDSDGAPYHDIEPGGIQTLPQGSTVTVTDPKNPPQSYDVIFKNQLRAISIALGIPYEILFGMTGDVNYSTMKSCHTTAFYKYGIEQALFSEIIIKPLAQMLTEDLVIMGLIPKLDKPYPIKCFPPEQEWIDPLKEIQGISVGLHANMTTLEEQLSLKNKDWRDTIDQRIVEEKYEIQKREENGLPPKNDMKNVDNSPGKSDTGGEIEKPKIAQEVGANA